VVPAEAKERRRNLRQLRAAFEHHRRQARELRSVTPHKSVIDAFLAHLASFCRIHTVGRLPDELVDSSIARFIHVQESAASRDQALIGLAGVRSGFFRNRRHMNRRKSNTGNGA